MKKTILYLHDNENGQYQIVVAETDDICFLETTARIAYDEWLKNDLYLDTEHYEYFSDYVVEKLNDMGIKASAPNVAEFYYN